LKDALTESLLQTEAIANRVVKNNTTLSELHKENEQAKFKSPTPYRKIKPKAVSEYLAYNQLDDTNNSTYIMYFEGYSK
jgi:hypothetical protein